MRQLFLNSRVVGTTLKISQHVNFCYQYNLYFLKVNQLNIFPECMPLTSIFIQTINTIISTFSEFYPSCSSLRIAGFPHPQSPLWLTVLSFEGAEQRQGACSDEINRQHRFRVLE